MVYIYVLKLVQVKYYIGKTNNPTYRLKNHFAEGGSSWTKKYSPISIHKIESDCDDEDEDKTTLQYMKKFGIENVRGGSFCKIKLDEPEIRVINQMILGSSDKCYNCGGDHFAKYCNKPKIKKIKCNRCGRSTHTMDKCYAKNDINGNRIGDIFNCQYCDKSFDSNKGCKFHENVHCIKRKNMNSYFDAANCLWDEYTSYGEDTSDEEYEEDTSE